MPRDESRGGMPEGVRSSAESGTPSALLWGLAWNAQSKQPRVHSKRQRIYRSALRQKWQFPGSGASIRRAAPAGSS
jgi:hypothetical protein